MGQVWHGKNGLRYSREESATPSLDPTTDTLAVANPVADGGLHEIVFIESTIADWQTMAAAVPKGAEVVLFNGQGDGLGEIASYLADKSGINAIHIITHGASGELLVGTDVITDASLPLYQADLAVIRTALAPGGDILLYGCDVAVGPVGVQFIDDLAADTGAVVAAATHAVGNAAEGGSWTLDATTGAVSVATIAAPAFAGILAPLPNFSENFTTESSLNSTTWKYTTSWAGAVGSSASGVELTQNTGSQNGILIYNSSFSAVDGIDLTFQYYMGPQTPANSADGIAFALLDGGQAVPTSAGSFGGGLGYNGISAGILGIGFDEYGNFTGAHTAADEGDLVVKGSTSANNPILTSVQPSSSGTPEAAGSGSSSYIDGTHTTEVILVYNNANSHYDLTVKLDGITEISNYDVTAAGVSIPSTLRFGFTASTGGSSNQHSIESVTVAVPTSVTGLTVASYTGNSAADVAKTATAADTPTLTGTAAAGDAIKVYVDSAQIGTTTADVNGNWTYTVTSPLVDGTHMLSATDSSSNTTSPNYSLTVDTPPTVTGVGGTGNTTSTSGTPAITGVAAPSTPSGTTITVFSDGAQIGTTTTSDAAGDWSFTPGTALADGSHSITAKETLGGVTSGASSGYSVSVTAPPSVTGADGPGNHSDTNTKPVITGTAAASTPTGTTVTISADGATIGTTTTASGGGWTFTPSTGLAIGTHSITATETVGSVTSTASSAYSLTIYAPPVVTGITSGSYTGPSAADAAHTATADGLPTVTGTAAPSATVTVYDGSNALGSTTANSSGAWSFTPTTVLSAATHSLTAKETISSYTSSASSAYSLTIDTPQIYLEAQPPQVSGTYAVTYDVSGSAIALDTIATLSEDSADTIYTTNGNYVGGSISVSTSNPTGSDALDVARASTVSNTAGALSVNSLGAVYLGTGSAATQIGTVTGAGTNQLEINFTSTLVTDAAVQTLARMVVYSNGIGSSGTAPSSADAVTMKVTTGFGNSSSQTVNVNFTNSHGANAAPTLGLNTQGTSATVATNGTAQVVDSGLTLSGNATVTAASVVVQNFVSGDVLGYTNANGLTGSYNATTGVLSVTGSGTTAQYQSYLRNVTFATSSSNTTARNVSFVVGGGLYDSSNNRFYEYVPSASITWYAAEAAASEMTLDGMSGYLANVNSASDNAFIASKLSGQGWMGASDNALSPTASTTDALTIGHWHWVDGPDSLMVGADGLPGEYFFQQTGGQTTEPTQAWPSGNTHGGYAVNGLYNSWDSPEPNDYGTEHYAHFYTTGLWNDYNYANTAIAGYVVEFGGMPTDPAVSVTGTAAVAVVSSVTAAQPVLSAASDTGRSTSDGITKDTVQTFTGTATGGAVVTLYNGSSVIGIATANSSGAWSITTTLGQGSYSITAKAAEFGLTSALSAGDSLVVDTTAPTVAITSVTPATAGDAADVTASTTPTIHGTVTDNVTGTSSVEVYVDGVDVGAATVSGNSWSFTSSALTHGVHEVAATATDVAGNISALSAATAITIDTPPTIGTSPTVANQGVTGATTITVAEDSSATLALHANDVDSGDLLVWQIGAAPTTGSATVSATGVVTYTPTRGQTAPDSFVVDVTDGLGGTASETVTVTTTAVNHAPVLTPLAGTVALGPTSESVASAPSSGVFTVASLLSGVSIMDFDTTRTATIGYATTGIAVVSVDNTNGEWSYSTNNGTSWTAFTNQTGGVLNISTAAVLLDGAAAGNTADKLKFVPNANFVGSASVGYVAWDEPTSQAIGSTVNLSTGTGGETDFSSAHQIASTAVTAVQTAPTIAASVVTAEYVESAPSVGFAGSSTNGVLVDPLLKLTNPADVNTGLDVIQSVTVESLIGPNESVTDQLSIPNYNVAGGPTNVTNTSSDPAKLQLTGTGTAAQWQTLLRTLTFQDTHNSDTGATTASRTIKYTINPGSSQSFTAVSISKNLAVTNITATDALEGIPYTAFPNAFDVQSLDAAGSGSGTGLVLTVHAYGGAITGDSFAVADDTTVPSLAVTADGGSTSLGASGTIEVGGTQLATYTDATGTLIIQFGTGAATPTQAQVNAVLNQIQFESSATVAVQATLADDTGATQTRLAATMTGSLVTPFPGTTWMAGGTMADPATVLTGSDPITLTMARGNGALAEDSFTGSGGLSFGSGSVTLDGSTVGTDGSVSNGTLTLQLDAGLTTAQIDEVVGLLQYTDTSSTPTDTNAGDGYMDTFPVAVTLSQASTTTLSAQTSVTLEALNNPPVETLPSAQTVNEATALDPTGFSVTDADAGSNNLVTTVQVDHGTLAATAQNSATLSGDGTDDLTITGSQTDITATLNSLVYTSTGPYAGTDTLLVSTDDEGNGGVDGPKTTTAATSIVVTQVNHAPVLAAAGPVTLTSVTEQTNSPAEATNIPITGWSVSQFIPAGAISDVDTSYNAANKLTGIAVTSVDNTNGEWFYSTDNGSLWAAFTSQTGGLETITSAAVLLDAAASGAATNLIKFVPKNYWNSLIGSTDPALTYVAWDESDGLAPGSIADLTASTGGGTHFSGASETVIQPVTAVNDAPLMSLMTDAGQADAGGLSVTGNRGLHTLSGFSTISAAPAAATDETNQALSYSISETDSGLFSLAPTISSDGTLSYATASGATGASTVTVMLTDDGGTANGGEDSTTDTFTVTVNAPASLSVPTVTGLTTATDTGLSHSDRITNDATPVIAGTIALSDVSDTIVVYIDGQAAGNATVNTNTGAWTLAVPSALSDGSHNITAIAKDVYSDVSASAIVAAIVVDRSTPAAPMVAGITSATDTGALGDGITSDASPVITGTALANSSVAVFAGLTPLGTVTADGNGAWSLTASNLTDGTYAVTAIATNVAGTPSVSSSVFSLTIAATPPAAPVVTGLTPATDTGASHTDGITSDASPVVTGTAPANASVSVYDGTLLLGTAMAGSNGAWSFAATALSDGLHVISAKATDAAAVVSAASTAYAVTIKTVASAIPAGLALAPASDSGVLGDDITNATTPAITGTGTVGDTITLYDGSNAVGTAVVAAGGMWSITTTALAVGLNNLTATDTDPAGNVSAASSALPLTIVTAVPPAPAGLALAPASDSGVLGDDITNATTPAITGTGKVGDTITLSDGSNAVGTAVVASGGTWLITTTSTLAPGLHTLTAVDTDPAGNVSAASSALPLTIITAAPAAPAGLALAPASDSGVLGDDITNATTPAITGTGTVGDTITLYDGSNAVGTAVVAAGGTWLITTTSTLAPGLHTLTAVDTNVAGTISAASSALPITIITAVPAAPAGLALAPASDSGVLGDDITNVTTPAITGTGTVGDTITLYDGSNAVGTAVVAVGGTWSITTTALAAGLNNLTATDTDPAGNVSAPSSALPLTIVTAVPAAPAGLALAPASDSGVLGDDITNATTPAITGTGTVGDTITLYDGSAPVGTATVGADGTWSITTTSALAPGLHTLTAVDTNVAGTISAASSALPITIDSTPPSPPAVLTLSPASDSGVPGDDMTVVTTPAITGTATAGDVITLYDGATPVGTSIAGPDGMWSITTGTLSVGPHMLTAKQTDPVGNVSAASAGLALTIDAEPEAPSALALAPASNTGDPNGTTTSVTQPVITGVGTPGDTITLTDGTTVVGTAVVGTDGTWSTTTSTLSSGAHSLSATQTDPAGDISAASAALSLTIDGTSVTNSEFALGNITEPVALGIIQPVNAAYSNGPFTITVSDLPNNGTLQLPDGTAVAAGQSLTVAQLTSLVFTPAAGASNQTSAFVYSVTDPSGSSTTGTIQLQTGSTPASLSATSQIPNTPTPAIAGTGTPGSAVTLIDNGVAISTTTAAAGTGAFTLMPQTPLTLGLNRLTVSTVTSGGNSSVSAPVVVFDLESPVVGVSTTDFSSADISNAMVQGAQLNFVSGTEAVQLTDATLSVGPDTGEATIQRLYEGLLGRTNDTGGISFYDAQLLAGGSPSDVAAQILASPEFNSNHGTMTDTQYVEELYQGLLGRSAAADTQSSFWTTQLAEGASRADVAIGVADSAESKSTLAPTTEQVFVPHASGTLAHELYETGLGREVELTALQNVDSDFPNETPEQAAAGVTASAEFTAAHSSQTNVEYVDSLYQAGLGRPADSGASFWTSLLNSGGASRSDVLLGIATSPEAIAHLTADLNS